MKHLNVITAFATGLLACTISHADDSQRYRFSKPFINGMLTMMQKMGVLEEQDHRAPNATGLNWPPMQAFGGIPGSQYMPGMIPGSGATQLPMQLAPKVTSNMMGIPKFRKGMPRQQPVDRLSQSPLDGIWEGKSGELLLMRDGRFRIYADKDKFSDGQLRIQDKILIMYNPRSKRTKRYRFALHEGRLALFDDKGQLLLYRRKK